MADQPDIAEMEKTLQTLVGKKLVSARGEYNILHDVSGIELRAEDGTTVLITLGTYR